MEKNEIKTTGKEKGEKILDELNNVRGMLESLFNNDPVSSESKTPGDSTSFFMFEED